MWAYGLNLFILPTINEVAFGEYNNNWYKLVIFMLFNYRDAAELEIRVLKKICKWDPKAEM